MPQLSVSYCETAKSAVKGESEVMLKFCTNYVKEFLHSPIITIIIPLPNMN